MRSQARVSKSRRRQESLVCSARPGGQLVTSEAIGHLVATVGESEAPGGVRRGESL